MKRVLWGVSVMTSPTAEEAASELLAKMFGQPIVAYQDFRTGKTSLTLFLEDPAPFANQKAELARALRRIRSVHVRSLRCQKLRKEDWAESWKRHFAPIEIGRKLLIKPSWSRRRGKRGQAVVILDPGLSFGTGQHPTTSFCLRELARVSARYSRQAFLDAGTGSGILAIAAVKLGFSPVDAFDFDPDALRVARVNARRNRVTGRIRFFRQDATKFRSLKRYSMICANLSTEVLEQVIGRLASRLAQDGVLVFAGILKQEFDLINKVAARAGLRLLRRRKEKEWSSGSFTLGAPSSRPCSPLVKSV